MNQISMLVVDDEYMILEGMKKLLPYEEFGITHIETAENAEIALAYFANHAVDIVLHSTEAIGVTYSISITGVFSEED